MDQQVIQDLILDNCIDQNEFNKNPERIKSLECFHFTLPVHPEFSAFPGLTELRIIEQDAVDLNWLKDCPNLIKLHVYHAPISDTTGLQYCPLLETLILEGANLKAFPDISKLTNLQDLDIAKNDIQVVSLFPSSNSLKNLNMAYLFLLLIQVLIYFKFTKS